MMKIVRARMHKEEEEGFTLIELLVVVLILGILMAIAIPTFLSLTSGAKTNAAESDLTTAAQDQATYFTQNGTYDVSAAQNIVDMKAIDSGINWGTNALAATSAGTKAVGIGANSTNWAPNIVVLSTVGSDGNTYWVQDTGGALLYARTTAAMVAAYPSNGDFAVGNTSWKVVNAITPLAA